jgi:hypothetical protein
VDRRDRPHAGAAGHPAGAATVAAPDIGPAKPRPGGGRLIIMVRPVPMLPDVLDSGSHRTPANAALPSHVAATPLTTHRAGLAHGALDARSVLVGKDGARLLTDWGTNTAASAAADMTAWTRLSQSPAVPVPPADGISPRQPIQLSSYRSSFGIPTPSDPTC